MVTKKQIKRKPLRNGGVNDRLAATYFHPRAIIGADGLNY